MHQKIANNKDGMDRLISRHSKRLSAIHNVLGDEGVKAYQDGKIIDKEIPDTVPAVSNRSQNRLSKRLVSPRSPRHSNRNNSTSPRSPKSSSKGLKKDSTENNTHESKRKSQSPRIEVKLY